jgi:hypothetical protein
LEKIPSSSPSHAKVREASDLEEGDSEMDLEEQYLARVYLEHLEHSYHK